MPTDLISRPLVPLAEQIRVTQAGLGRQLEESERLRVGKPIRQLLQEAVRRGAADRRRRGQHA